MIMKIFISIPYISRNYDTEEEVKNVVEKAMEDIPTRKIVKKVGDNWVVIKQARNKNNTMDHSGKNISELSKCDAVYFCKGWKNDRDCKLVHYAAALFDIPIMYARK